MFYEAMEDVLPDIKVIIQSEESNTSTILPLDSFVTESSLSDDASANAGNSSRNSNANSNDNSAQEDED